MSAQKLSAGMRQVLVDLAAGRSARHSLPPGRSASGGFEGTLRALERRGLIAWQGHFIITDAGRAAAGVAVLNEAQPAMVCSRCKVDRYKQPCGDPHYGVCPLTGTTGVEVLGTPTPRTAQTDASAKGSSDA
ncbi:MAG: hypothetical protein JWQ03_604 [Variovorax sp.]|nr:hypothetical protein [Variovorax sp.]